MANDDFTGSCDECSETRTVRFVDNTLRCANVCYTCVPAKITADTISERTARAAIERYTARCVPQPNVSVASSLLAYWDRPWSSNAQRFAYHAIGRALRLGFDVLGPL